MSIRQEINYEFQVSKRLGMIEHEYWLNSNNASAKVVWDTLETTHEGTSQVKVAKVKMLTTKLENIKMLKEETFKEF